MCIWKKSSKNVPSVCCYMQAQVFATCKSFLRGWVQESVHKHYAAAQSLERDIDELCTASPSTHRASAHIQGIPVCSLSSLSCHWSTLTHGMSTWTASGQHLLPVDPLNYQVSWNLLSPCCPGRAIFIPEQPLCSPTCHLHSALPAAVLLTASEREGSHNISPTGGVPIQAVDCVVLSLLTSADEEPRTPLQLKFSH